MPEDELASKTIHASSRTVFPPLPVGFPDDLYKESEHFLIPCEARPYHMYVVGTTGAGKSSLARNMIASDIAWGMGVSVVDPHGYLVRALLENHIPKSRTNDVIYIEPTNPTRTIGLNILEGLIPEHRPLVVSQIVSIFYKLYKESWGPRLKDILGNSLYALLEQPRPVSLAAIPKLLTNAEYRAEVLQHVHNPIVRAAIFTNTATKMSFRVSPEDAERLKKAFTMNRDESELQDLPNYSVYVHTLKTHPTTGVTRPSGPHLVNVFPPFDKTADDNAGERVLRASNRAYTRPRAEVMEAINRFLAPKPKPEKPVKKPRRNLTMEAVGRVEAKLNRIAPEPLPRPALPTSKAPRTASQLTAA